MPAYMIDVFQFGNTVQFVMKSYRDFYTAGCAYIRTFQTVYSVRLQENEQGSVISWTLTEYTVGNVETNRLFSEPALLQKSLKTWFYPWNELVIVISDPKWGNNLYGYNLGMWCCDIPKDGTPPLNKGRHFLHLIWSGLVPLE